LRSSTNGDEQDGDTAKGRAQKSLHNIGPFVQEAGSAGNPPHREAEPFKEVNGILRAMDCTFHAGDIVDAAKRKSGRPGAPERNGVREISRAEFFFDRGEIGADGALGQPDLPADFVAPQTPGVGHEDLALELIECVAAP
jgi:hypothetical protein